MTDELVTRLRDEEHLPQRQVRDACFQAAARIEADAATIARLRDEAFEWRDKAMENFNRATKASQDADAAEAQVAALVDALTPFAEYMADGMDQEHNGAPLPDSEGVGWIYLTHGDFRRARAAIAAAKGGA